jgi:Fur family zinc uptake transcriptional regulator
VQEAPSDLVARGLLGAAEHAGFRPVHPIVELEGECARCLDAKAA